MAIRAPRRTIVAGAILRAVLVLVLRVRDDAHYVDRAMSYSADLQRENYGKSSEQEEQDRQVPRSATPTYIPLHWPKISANAATLTR
jgi:hypothetical protein